MTNTNTMIGSEKQITWASEIKNNLDWDGVLEHPVVVEFKKIISEINDATWWIDNKDCNGCQLLESAVGGGIVIEHKPQRLLLKIDPQTCEMTINTTVFDSKNPKLYTVVKTEKVEV